ncbi:MAG: hypothetical protein QOG65_533, partial [Actinomycetota bacterium]|nr:hypothetical protein [Actinomycetota bacterium]
MVLDAPGSNRSVNSPNQPADPAAAVVADELALVRAGITAVLDGRGIDVIAQTRSGREVVSIATVDRPDLVVLGAPADPAAAVVADELAL